MIRQLIIEIKRSQLRFVLPVLILVQVLIMIYRENGQWAYVWPQASVAVQLPTYFVGPILSAAVAWRANKIKQTGIYHLVSYHSVRPWKSHIVFLISGFFYALLTIGSGSFVAFLLAKDKAGPGFFWFGYLTVAFVALSFCVLLGHLVGSLFSTAWFTPTLAALLSYLLLTLVSDQNGDTLNLLVGYPWETVNKAKLWALIITIMLLSLLISNAIPYFEVNSGSGKGYALLSLATICGLSLLVLGATFVNVKSGPLVIARNPPSGPMCGGQNPEICIWPENQHYMQELIGFTDRVRVLPGFDWDLPDRFSENGLFIKPDSRASGLPVSESRTGFVLLASSTWSVASDLAGEILEKNIETTCIPENESDYEKWQLAYFNLIAWMEGYIYGSNKPGDVFGGPPGVDENEISLVLSKSESEQGNWVNSQFQIIQDMENSGNCA